MGNAIQSKEQLCQLWSQTYNAAGKPDWSHILPYYAEDMKFRDSVQAIHGIEDFKAMTERLATRSKDLKMEITNSVKDGNTIMLEWIMTISFGKYPDSNIYGASRIVLNEEGKIADQRDYYDLWGDIFDNIPFMARRYRKFMKKKFG